MLRACGILCWMSEEVFAGVERLSQCVGRGVFGAGSGSIYDSGSYSERLAAFPGSVGYYFRSRQTCSLPRGGAFTYRGAARYRIVGGAAAGVWIPVLSTCGGLFGPGADGSYRGKRYLRLSRFGTSIVCRRVAADGCGRIAAGKSGLPSAPKRKLRFGAMPERSRVDLHMIVVDAGRGAVVGRDCRADAAALPPHQSSMPSRTSWRRTRAQSTTGRLTPSTKRRGHPKAESSI